MKIWQLLLAFLVATMVLTSCNSDGDSLSMASRQANPDGLYSETVTNIPVTPKAFSTPPKVIVENKEPENGVAEDENADQSLLGLERCGLILPLISESTEPEDISHDINIPDGMLPNEALPALERLISAPETVALVAYELGRETQGVYHNANLPMPLASVVKIVNLVAYAEAAAEGILNPADWINLDELNQYYLPGSDLGAHNRALSELEERGLIGRDPPSVPLEEVPWMMIRHSSNAASDFIHLTLGQRKIESTAVQLGLTSQTAPCPWIGQFLTMNNSERSASSSRAYVQEMIVDPAEYGREVMRLSIAFTEDPDFRADELSQRWRSDINTQRLFGHNLNAQGSAQEYADLMAQILRNELSSPYVNILVRRVLEWPAELAANQENFNVVGYKNGSLPGILTTVYYGQRKEDGTQLVVALFFSDLPMNIYRNWRQSLPHDELARWLLIHPSAIELLGQLLNESQTLSYTGSELSGP